MGGVASSEDELLGNDNGSADVSDAESEGGSSQTSEFEADLDSAGRSMHTCKHCILKF